MCETPNRIIVDGRTVEIGCRDCWQCTERYINDWVGRCIAESQTALAAHSCTLTYGRDEEGNADHLRAAVLTYSDVQKWLKLVRHNGYSPRYFCVGEYGGMKGRSHWHLIVYWQDNSEHIARLKARAKKRKNKRPIPEGPVPPLTLETEMVVQAHWKHGFSYWEDLKGADPVSNCRAVRYVCKYTQKDLEDMEAQGKLTMSKMPPLGAAWFRELAGRHVAQGLAPQSLIYRHDGIVTKEGRLKEFMIKKGSASHDLFCQAYVDRWAEAHPGRSMPRSKLIEEFIDTGAWEKRSTLEGQFAWERKAERMDEQQRRSNDAMTTVRYLDPSSPEFF